MTNKSNKTWEWGYYICVKLDANQTPDAVNYLYFCHCSKLLASVGQKVKTGDVLAVVGQTGNAAGTWTHCHFEVRATATSKGLDPSAYAVVAAYSVGDFLAFTLQFSPAHALPMMAGRLLSGLLAVVLCLKL